MNKIILADNQSVFRAGAARILAVEEDCRIIGQCDDLPRLMAAARSTQNAILVFASSLHPDIGTLVRLSKQSAGQTVAVLENEENPQEFLREGVTGILYRDVPSLELLRCIRLAGRGNTYQQKRAAGAPGSVESTVIAERVRERLTPKELTIVGLILQGYKNRQIAEELHNSEQVIKNYLRSIFDKTGVSDRLELALFAMHHKVFAGAPPVVRPGMSVQ